MVTVLERIALSLSVTVLGAACRWVDLSLKVFCQQTTIWFVPPSHPYGFKLPESLVIDNLYCDGKGDVQVQNNRSQQTCLLVSKQYSKEASKTYLNFREQVQADRTEVPVLYLAAWHTEPSVALLRFGKSLHQALQEKLSLFLAFPTRQQWAVSLFLSSHQISLLLSSFELSHCLSVIILKFIITCSLQFFPFNFSSFQVPVHLLCFPDYTPVLHIVPLNTKAELAQKCLMLPCRPQSVLSRY